MLKQFAELDVTRYMKECDAAYPELAPALPAEANDSSLRSAAMSLSSFFVLFNTTASLSFRLTICTVTGDFSRGVSPVFQMG